MAKIHGKVTFVSLDGDDLSAHSNNVEFVRSGDSHDVTTFGIPGVCTGALPGLTT